MDDLTVLDPPMSKRNDVSVKISPESLRIAKLVATHEDRGVAEFLSDLVMEFGFPKLEAYQKAMTPPVKRPKGGKS